ncbi:MAG TPA: PhzF family phenazine biosynthesis protein [Devosiaceae bacterium]|nr:PhzF family phenazine biosynthesis protein [Devosiaceae bacterium]
MKHAFYIVDVFTRDRLAGNPLAVVMDSDTLKDALMQRVAAEFGFSQTVFLKAPQDARHLVSLRIFTPRMELPFAGHPTIGAPVVLGLKKRAAAIRMEQKIGVVTTVVEKIDDRTGSARFNVPRLPERIATEVTAAAAAGPLGLQAEEIGFGAFEPSVWSTGVPFTLVPVSDRDALGRIRIQRRGWLDVFKEGNGAVYAYTPGSMNQGYDYAARMFSPMTGIEEDPATGSAAAAMGGPISIWGGFAEGGHALTVRQGAEMGRPSTIELQIRIEGGALTHVAIGGAAVILAEGHLDLPA